MDIKSALMWNTPVIVTFVPDFRKPFGRPDIFLGFDFSKMCIS